MRKLYGDTLRTDAGFVKVIKKVAQKNARLLETRAGKHAPEIKRVAKEVKGTIDKVYVETAEAVEEFLARCTLLHDHDFREADSSCTCSKTKDNRSRPGYKGSSAAVSGKTRHFVRIPTLFTVVSSLTVATDESQVICHVTTPRNTPFP